MKPETHLPIDPDLVFRAFMLFWALLFLVCIISIVFGVVRVIKNWLENRRGV